MSVLAVPNAGGWRWPRVARTVFVSELAPEGRTLSVLGGDGRSLDVRGTASCMTSAYDHDERGGWVVLPVTAPRADPVGGPSETRLHVARVAGDDWGDPFELGPVDATCGWMLARSGEHPLVIGPGSRPQTLDVYMMSGSMEAVDTRRIGQVASLHAPMRADAALLARTTDGGLYTIAVDDLPDPAVAWSAIASDVDAVLELPSEPELVLARISGAWTIVDGTRTTPLPDLPQGLDAADLRSGHLLAVSNGTAWFGEVRKGTWDISEAPVDGQAAVAILDPDAARLITLIDGRPWRWQAAFSSSWEGDCGAPASDGPAEAPLGMAWALVTIALAFMGAGLARRRSGRRDKGMP